VGVWAFVPLADFLVVVFLFVDFAFEAVEVGFLFESFDFAALDRDVPRERDFVFEADLRALVFRALDFFFTVRVFFRTTTEISLQMGGKSSAIM